MSTPAKKFFRKPRALPPNAMMEQTEATHEKLFFLMGKPLLFQTNHEGLLEAAEDAFRRFKVQPGKFDQPPLTLRLLLHESSRTTSAAAVPSNVIYRTQGHLYYIAVDEENTATADLSAGYAFGFLTHELAADLPKVRFVFLEGLALAMLQVRHHYAGLHASCVVKNGRAILFQGSAGRGKTTLAYACARRGFQLLGEDGVLVECGPAGYRLWGSPWKIHLLPDAINFFPELQDEEPRLQINREWKLEVDPEKYFPGSTTTNSEPGCVVFLERGGDCETSIEPIDLAAAIDKFELIWPWSVGWTEELEDLESNLLKDRSYRLRINGSPDETVTILEAFFEDWRSEIGA